MRAGAVAIATIVVVRVASAEPRSRPFEASGFVGVGWFADDTELGNSWAPEQVPNTAPVLGGRFGWLVVPALIERGRLQVQLAVEAELSIATAFTGGSSFTGGTGRRSYFAPVFGWRAHGSLRLSGSRHVRPHLVVGGGGETVASSSPFMSKETDPVFYWGPGVAVPVSDRWQARLDLRHGIMASRDTGTSSTIELQFGVATSFGGSTSPRPAAAPAPVPPAITGDRDTDEDGLPDRLDACPTERETVNGVDDGDGCAELDPDGDGIVGAADTCPNASEDLDRFADEDGCPELDNEQDGIEDARDVCPLEPETRNAIDDDDGCPDTIPDDVTQALAVGPRVKFEPNRARITNAAKQALQPLFAMLAARPGLRITIVGRPERAGGEDLANRRAEAVKWFLVDAGVLEGRIETRTGAPGKPIIELTLGTPK